LVILGFQRRTITGDASNAPLTFSESTEGGF